MEKKEKEIPSVVYKYIPSTYASSVLGGGTMRIASRTGYNDPFEMQYQWENLNAETVLSNLDRQILTQVTGLSANADDQKNSKEIEYLLSNIIKNKEQIDCQQDNIPDPRNLLTLFDAFIRICSFMREHDSITMWSHYANDHQGICVKFNPLILTKAMCQHFDQQNCVEWRPVQYDKPEYPPFHPIRVFMHEDNDSMIQDALPLRKSTLEMFFDILTTKGEEWASENEIRMIISALPKEGITPLGGRMPSPPDWPWLGQKKEKTDFLRPKQNSVKNNYQNTMDVLNFPPEAVESIYLGCKANSQFIEQIQALCAKQYPHASLFQMKKAGNKYELTADPLP